MNRLDQQMKFILEADKLKQVFRQSYLSDESRKENDAEHSWHLAVMAYLLQEYADEPVDLSRVMIMVLMHDMVEIYAGDTYAYDTENQSTQRAREEEAAERLYSLLPKDQKETLLAIFREFEEAKTPEARFANTLDNLEPLMLNDAVNGRGWREHQIRYEQVRSRQEKKLVGSKVLKEYAKELVEKNVKKGNILDS